MGDFGGRSKERRMTPKGQMSGNGSGPPIAHLPPMMKAMFQASAPLEPKPPVPKRKATPFTGVSSIVGMFETTEPAPRPAFEPPKERRERLRKAKMEANDVKLQAALAAWDPHKPKDPEKVTSDAYKTLFVARLSYDTNERKLRREFEQFGPIKMLRIILDNDGESRGYAFIEYEREADMREAFKRTDGRKIDGYRVVVDVERGRTVRNWRPRKFGGGLGSSRRGGKKDEPGSSSRDSDRRPDDRNSSNYRGGDRGGGGRAPDSRYGGDRRGYDSRPPRAGDSRGGDRYGGGYGGGGDRGGGDRYGGPPSDRGRDRNRDGGDRDDRRRRSSRSRSRDRGGGGYTR